MKLHQSPRPHRRPIRWALASLAVLAAGCGAGNPWSGISPPVREKAEQEFKSICVTCHGSTGHGDGPGAAELDPKPRSFADAQWQASVTDEHIARTITAGGAAVGKNAAMPAHPQFKSQPEVLRGLVAKVRSFGIQK